MSTKRLSHLKEWEKIYIPLERILHLRDDTDWLCFHDVNWCISWMDDEDTFYTLDDLKQLANDGMPNDNIPKQGDEIEVRTYSTEKEWEIKTVSHTALITTDGKPYALGQWRYPPKKIQKTLAELEKELGYEEGTLEITN